MALTLTERYRYEDGGPAGPGRRILRFRPVDKDPLLFEGELTVLEESGRIQEERSSRSNLPGIVRSETRTLTYGEPRPGPLAGGEDPHRRALDGIGRREPGPAGHRPVRLQDQ